MAMGDIDLSLKPAKLELFLAKPDKTIIKKVSEAYNKTLSVKLGNINELVFTIPFNIDIGHKLSVNPTADILRDRYLIKAVIGTEEEWYIINAIEDTADDSNEVKIATAYLLPYEMAGKNVRSFSEISINMTTVLSGGTTIDINTGQPREVVGILNNTRWKVGYIDAAFDVKYRSFEFSSTTVLDALFQVAETFNALIIWDTENRKIEFHNAENYGVDRGLSLSYGHYLQSLTRESKSDEMVTRLKVFGKEGMSIQDVNLTGQNYIEDYSYFMYPFQRDTSKNVISHSDYMSDALCHAILDYTAYLQGKQGTFSALKQQVEKFQVTLTEKNNDLSKLKEELKYIDNELDSFNAKGDSVSAAAEVVKKDAKQAEIVTKQGEITAAQSNVVVAQSSVQSLRNSMAYNQFFTPALLTELNDYVIEKEWTNENYSDAQALYDDALEDFETMKIPQVVITIDAVNFLDIVESQRDWSKLVLGDIMTIRHDRVKANMTAKLIEYTIDFEESKITLTIANTKDILSDEEKLVKMIYASSSASTTLNASKSIWDGVEATKSTVEAYINSAMDATKQSILAGVNNTVTISERGILIRDTTDPNTYLVIQNGVLAITRNNGNTWSHAITKDGIIGERIIGKILAGTNLTIDATDNKGQRLFLVDGNGVTIAGGSLKVVGGLPASELDPTILANIDTDIAEVEASVNALEVNVDNMLSDAMITSIEANSLKISLAQVDSESIDLINAASVLGIADERTNYDTAVKALKTELNKWVDQANYPISVTAAQRLVIKQRFSTLQSTKSVLINKIAAVRQANSQTYTDGKVTTLNAAISTLDSDIDRFSSDNVITLAEANSLKNSLAQVTSESASIVSVAGTLGITTLTTNYSSALTSLTTEVNKWIDKSYPLTITAANRTSIKTAFENLQNRKSLLINEIAAVREQRAKDASVGLGKAYNGVTIDAANGLVIVKSDVSIRTVLNATQGFMFQKNTGSMSSPTWSNMLFYDVTSGNLTVDGIINARDIKVNGASVLTSDGKFKTQSIETLYIGRNVFMAPEATISYTQISDKPYIPTVPGYITSTRITSTTIESPNIYGGTITIGAGEDVWKADSQGVYLGASTFAAAPFSVSMKGVLTALNGNFKGSITGSTITGSTITGSTIRSRQSANSGAGVELLSNFGDIRVYDATGSNIFRVEDGADGNIWLYNPHSFGALQLSRGGDNVYANGNWKFTGNVTGITATFA
ncbi:phage tail spike protein [Paenibacillus sp. FSL R7-0302]|uniref:phage tail spike protein n=1 Tax=Paenibacillus sp. FSL R7-0302 TaxID=2921681 RepID=UPI0030F5D5CE